jgi:cell fate regulator YaaT (PSP1 superfamily)
MIQARRVVDELKLQMKINDVEYQGDKTKCIFYYTAEGRVDFRELIKILAEKFSVRIEMKQIGVRQESSRLGGIGSCGRELCCSSWLTNFRSVSTTAARTQQLSMNPQKLAGQCGKLKCCLNFEYDNYKEETKKFPSTNSLLQTKSGDAFFQKMDILSGIMYYSYKDKPAVFIPIQREDVKDIQQMNRNGKMPDALDEYSDAPVEEVRFENVIGQDDLNRFDNLNKPARKKGNKNRNGSQNKNTDNSRKVQGNSNNKKRKEFSRDNNKSKGAGEQKNVNQSNSRNQQNNARSEKPTNINRPKKRFDKRSNRPNTTE